MRQEPALTMTADAAAGVPAAVSTTSLRHMTCCVACGESARTVAPSHPLPFDQAREANPTIQLLRIAPAGKDLRSDNVEVTPERLLVTHWHVLTEMNAGRAWLT